MRHLTWWQMIQMWKWIFADNTILVEIVRTINAMDVMPTTLLLSTATIAFVHQKNLSHIFSSWPWLTHKSYIDKQWQTWIMPEDTKCIRVCVCVSGFQSQTSIRPIRRSISISTKSHADPSVFSVSFRAVYVTLSCSNMRVCIYVYSTYLPIS